MQQSHTQGMHLSILTHILCLWFDGEPAVLHCGETACCFGTVTHAVYTCGVYIPTVVLPNVHCTPLFKSLSSQTEEALCLVQALCQVVAAQVLGQKFLHKSSQSRSFSQNTF